MKTAPKAAPKSAFAQLADKVAAAGAPTLKVEAGFGFEASLDEDVLVVQQTDNEGGTDSVSLSRREARLLFEEFEEWANA